MKILVLCLILVLLPFCGMAIDLRGNSSIQIGATILSFCNLALFITALSSIKQHFWPGYNNRMPFHVFNIIFAVLFYGIGLPFLISNRQYYEGYADLAPISVLRKFFFTIDISSFAQWVIIASVVVNIIYIKRNYSDYYEAGIVNTEDKPVTNTNDSLPAADTTTEAEVLQDDFTR